MERRNSLLQELIPRPQCVRAESNGAVQVDQLIALPILRPLRQSRSVGISSLGEVGPVAHELVAQLAILGPPFGTGPSVERPKDILDVVGVKRKRPQMELAWGAASSKW